MEKVNLNVVKEENVLLFDIYKKISKIFFIIFVFIYFILFYIKLIII
jgi:hypothetical protein